MKTDNYFGKPQPKALTEEKREEYLLEYLNGSTYAEIGKRHNLALSTITKLIKTKAYGTGRGKLFEDAKVYNRAKGFAKRRAKNEESKG